MNAFNEYYTDTYEYPEHTMLLHGIQPGTAFYYVSSTYLNGFINYVDIIDAVMIQQYRNDEEFDAAIKKIENKDSYHTHFGNEYDDIMILGKTDDMYVCFYFDNDVSDCDIGGVSIDEFKTDNEAIESFRQYVKYVKEIQESKRTYNIPVSKLTGWISF